MPIITNNDNLDPRLNCAAEICCGHKSALETTATILSECGVPADYCASVAKTLSDKGVVLMPAQLAQVIKQIAHPG